MRLFLFCAVFISCFGCHRTKSDNRNISSLSELTATERKYLVKYGEARKKVTDFFHLPESATVEELRPHLAGFLKLHRTAAWDEMLQMPLIRSLCTEKRRERLVVIFRLKPDATWAELGFRVEELWARLQTAR